ncbi:hypothetical protein [Roseateles terrae]|uniref:Uncharacterized protein n=1 Tax=Roseateles terrae TaxID=431060 RepID=A0ABR6GPL8_9BURK|nr:hypothetical protein [Roseateles terrae]MBB3193975.1 hypothetical protein [Roseateles terrae]OWQ87850.1 hypothetical protein CDN98_06705 [Roseateles terrae]
MNVERPFRLVQFPKQSHDVVKCLKKLLERAERGEIIGISYAAMESNREFFFSSCGEAHRNPAFASALASTLWYGTMKRVFNEDS